MLPFHRTNGDCSLKVPGKPQNIMNMWVFPKIRRNTPKMDGENNGSKPYEQMDDLGGKKHHFWFNTHVNSDLASWPFDLHRNLPACYLCWSPHRPYQVHSSDTPQSPLLGTDNRNIKLNLNLRKLTNHDEKPWPPRTAGFRWGMRKIIKFRATPFFLKCSSLQILPPRTRFPTLK